jgi:hypothetical protein
MKLSEPLLDTGMLQTSATSRVCTRTTRVVPGVPALDVNGIGVRLTGIQMILAGPRQHSCLMKHRPHRSCPGPV